jgi:hypothetical protein
MFGQKPKPTRQERWVKQDPSKTSGLLNIQEEEWEKAYAAAEKLVAQGKKPPFKIPKSQWGGSRNLMKSEAYY